MKTPHLRGFVQRSLATLVLAHGVLLAGCAFAVGDNVIALESTDVAADPNNGYYPPLSAPLLDASGTVYWADLRPGNRLLLSDGGQIASDTRTTVDSGDFPVGYPSDVLNGVVVNDGLNFVPQGNSSLLNVSAIFRNGTTKLVDFNSTFPGITSDENLQATVGRLDDDGSLVFMANRSQFSGTPVDALCRLNGGAITVLASAGATVSPDGGKFTAIVAPTVSHGVILFYGETSKGTHGVYQLAAGRFTSVVDTHAVFPPIGQPASIFQYGSVQYFNEGTDVALAFTEFGGGVYKRVGGKWALVVQALSPIPNGTGFFDSVNAPAISQGRVAFAGYRSNVFAPPNQTGVYVEVANGIAAVVNESDSFGGKNPTRFLTNNRWWNGAALAVLAAGDDWSSVAKVTVAPHPLTVQDDTFVIRSAGANPMPVLNNDTGPWGSTLQVTAVTQGTLGTVKLAAGKVTYTPGPHFAGTDQFTYTVTANGVTAIGTVHVQDPFIALHGSFSQLIAGTAGTGLVSGTLTSGGLLTAKLQIGGKTYALKGPLTDGAEFGIYQSGMGSLDSKFALVNNVPQLSGTLSNYPNTYSIAATPLSATAVAANVPVGSYTLRLLPDGDPTHPRGFGWAHLKLSATGAVTITGKLGDGTALSTGGALRGDATVPLFTSLYANPLGNLAGVLTYADLLQSDFTGTLAWTKPAQTVPGKIYPAGFTATATVSGSLFVPPKTGARSFIYTSVTPALAIVKISDPAVAEIDATKIVSAADLCTVSGSNPNSVLVTLNRKTGDFTGSYVPTGGAKRLFTGVQDVKANLAAGVFTTTDASGAVLFEPQ